MVSGYFAFVRLISRSREYDFDFLSLQVTIITMPALVPLPAPCAITVVWLASLAIDLATRWKIFSHTSRWNGLRLY